MKRLLIVFAIFLLITQCVYSQTVPHYDSLGNVTYTTSIKSKKQVVKQNQYLNYKHKKRG
jgi:hypothetical protein